MLTGSLSEEIFGLGAMGGFGPLDIEFVLGSVPGPDNADGNLEAATEAR